MTNVNVTITASRDCQVTFRTLPVGQWFTLPNRVTGFNSCLSVFVKTNSVAALRFPVQAVVAWDDDAVVVPLDSIEVFAVR